MVGRGGADCHFVFGGYRFFATGLVADSDAILYQRDRLLVYFGRDYTHFAPPTATPVELQRMRQQQLDDEYNVRQALISVGSGGLAGKVLAARNPKCPGLSAARSGTQRLHFLRHCRGGRIRWQRCYTDAVWCGPVHRIKDRRPGARPPGKTRGGGRCDRSIFSHVFINIGMNIRIMPVTGVPLPLLSYGGSSVLCSLIALGLMQNVYIHRRGY